MSTCSDKGENTDNCFVLRERKMKVDKCVAKSFILCDFCTRVRERAPGMRQSVAQNLIFTAQSWFLKSADNCPKEDQEAFEKQGSGFWNHFVVVPISWSCLAVRGRLLGWETGKEVRTVEKSQTSAINASLQMSRQGIWGYTNEDRHMRWGWKHCTEAKMATAQYNAFI